MRLLGIFLIALIITYAVSFGILLPVENRKGDFFAQDMDYKAGYFATLFAISAMIGGVAIGITKAKRRIKLRN